MPPLPPSQTAVPARGQAPGSGVTEDWETIVALPRFLLPTRVCVCKDSPDPSLARAVVL